MLIRSINTHLAHFMLLLSVAVAVAAALPRYRHVDQLEFTVRVGGRTQHEISSRGLDRLRYDP